MKFIFRDDELEVALGETEKETENAFVGGANVWKYDTFTNWEFWWPGFPVLVYFKVGTPSGEPSCHRTVCISGHRGMKENSSMLYRRDGLVLILFSHRRLTGFPLKPCFIESGIA